MRFTINIVVRKTSERWGDEEECWECCDLVELVRFCPDITIISHLMGPATSLPDFIIQILTGLCHLGSTVLPRRLYLNFSHLN